MSVKQKAIHDHLLEGLFEVLNMEVDSMTLETASYTVIEFCAGALFYMHKDVDQLDLLNPLYEAERLALLIVGLKGQGKGE